MSNSLALVSRSADDVTLFPSKRSATCNILHKFVIHPVIYLPKRIAMSFIPPIWNVKISTHIYIDFLGPLLGIILLICLLQYGYSKKTITPADESLVKVITHILSYYIGMSLFVFTASRIVRANLKFFEATTMIGYSSYGCTLTMGIPFLIDNKSDYLFLICLVITGGSCGLRVLMLLLFAIQVPVARLLICSFFGSIHNLFLIYIYYMYMHSTFTFYEYSY